MCLSKASHILVLAQTFCCIWKQNVPPNAKGTQNRLHRVINTMMDWSFDELICIWHKTWGKHIKKLMQIHGSSSLELNSGEQNHRSWWVLWLNWFMCYFLTRWMTAAFRGQCHVQQWRVFDSRKNVSKQVQVEISLNCWNWGSVFDFRRWWSFALQLFPADKNKTSLHQIVWHSAKNVNNGAFRAETSSSNHVWLKSRSLIYQETCFLIHKTPSVLRGKKKQSAECDLKQQHSNTVHFSKLGAYTPNERGKGSLSESIQHHLIVKIRHKAEWTGSTMKGRWEEANQRRE